MRAVILGVAVCWGLLSSPAASADTTRQAERLAALRAEVEALSDAVQADKDAVRGELRALEAQRVDLEVQLRREELRLERLVEEEARIQAAIRASSTGSEGIKNAVGDGIAMVRDTVAGGLPFQQEARLAALATLETQLADGALPPEQVAARLWAFAEDERRLRRENALARQLAVIDGEEALVDVARLGMVAMYWRSPDGRVGQVVRTGGDWAWRPLADPAAQVQVAALFDALERGIRTGWFPLPAPLQALALEAP